MKMTGFTLIEILVFIVVTGLLINVLLIGSLTSLRSAPTVHAQWVAIQTARQCMEWFLGQRRVNGYAALTCPSTLSSSVCSVPSGFSITATVACTTWNGDSNYKTIAITVGGLANASLSSQIGDF